MGEKGKSGTRRPFLQGQLPVNVATSAWLNLVFLATVKNVPPRFYKTDCASQLVGQLQHLKLVIIKLVELSSCLFGQLLQRDQRRTLFFVLPYPTDS